MVKSLGATMTLFSMLEELEQIKIQACSRWMYDVGVGRVQTRFPQHRSKYFITTKEAQFRLYELKYNSYLTYDIWEW